MRLFLPVLLGFFSLQQYAVANELRSDGNELLSNCNVLIRVVDEDVFTNEDAFSAGRCLGIIHAVRGVLEPVGVKSICVPQQATDGQLARVVVNHAKQFPQSLHIQDVVFVLTALGHNYPCKD